MSQTSTNLDTNANADSSTDASANALSPSSDRTYSDDIRSPISQAITGVKSQNPLVQNITNFVAMNPGANILLAIGASPAMLHAIDEAPEFVKLTNALTINIGTLSQPWVDSMLATTKVAHDTNIPWVFDPVAVGVTAFRRDVGQKLLAHKPAVIRGNASEIMALAGNAGQSKGADAGDAVESAKASARALTEHADVVVVTGEVDYVTDGNQAWQVLHGEAMMTQITALGCGLTGVMGAFAGAKPKDISLGEAMVASLCLYGQAGEHAKSRLGPDQGTGSLYVNFLDALTVLTAKHVAQNARVEVSTCN